MQADSVKVNSCLVSLSEELVCRDVEKLKFICQEFVSASKLENLKNSLELFDILQQRRVISKDNMQFLVECLEVIGRLDLLKLVDYDANASSFVQVSEFRKVLIKVSEEMLQEEIEKIKFLLISNREFSRSVIKGVHSGLDVFNLLFKMNRLSSSNVDYLRGLLKEISRADLCELLGQYINLTQQNNENCSASNPSSHSIIKPEEKNYSMMNTLDVQNNLTLRQTEAKVMDHVEGVHCEMEAAVYSLNAARLKVDQDLRQHSPTEYNFPCYKMIANPKGICVIINNVNFSKPAGGGGADMPDRIGSDIDAESLTKTFENLNFEIENHKNLTETQMVRILLNVGQKDHSNYDCFVCCILSHGTKDYIFGTNCEKVEILDLTRNFKGTFCKSLVGKPKLFFIQACQGEKRQKGVDIEMDDPPRALQPLTIPNEADFLIAYATVPGYVSFRSKSCGSWFIKALVDMLNKYASSQDLMTILLKVNEVVASAIAPIEGIHFKQVPAPIFTLRKKLYFR